MYQSVKQSLPLSIPAASLATAKQFLVAALQVSKGLSCKKILFRRQLLDSITLTEKFFHMLIKVHIEAVRCVINFLRRGMGPNYFTHSCHIPNCCRDI